jgi:hypothetical protein
MYETFCEIAGKINAKFETVPLLYGSLGLQRLIKADLHPGDIDVLLPKRFINIDWSQLVEFMQNEGYELIDEHEHTFQKAELHISFAVNDLEDYAGIDMSEVSTVTDRGAEYLLLTLPQYLKVYAKSSEDSYRRNKNNDKDFERIGLIQTALNRAINKEN